MATPVQSNSSFKPFAIVIKNHYQPTYSLRLIIDSANMTIGKLKSKIEQQHKGNPLIQDQLLVYRGKLLESKTNLFQLLQSSIIKPTSPTNNHIPDDDTPSMYIHMTLRGGSDTATKIGLTQNPPEPPQNPPKPVQPPPPAPEPEPEEEQKYEKPTSSQANETISPQFTPHSRPRPPPPPHYMHAHAQQPPHAYHHYYNMPPPPPPNPYYFSHSMPDLYHPSAYAHRGQSLPSNYANPSQPFAPPTLVQQASNPNQNAPFHPMHAPYAHYMAQPHGHPPPMPQFHRFGHFGVRSHSTSDLRYLRNINAQTPPQHIVPSKIEEKDEKNDAKEDKDEKNNVRNDGNDANAQRFGLRQRRVPNVANNENNGGNAVGNNGNDARNDANDGNNNDAVREGWFGWFFRILNINVLIRLGIFMWLFGPNLGTYRFSMLCVLGGFYYLHQIGILHRIFGRFMGRNRNRNEVQHRDPNAANDGSENNNNERVALLPLNYVQLLQRFLIGIFASLWPTWDHRNVYPANHRQ